jgi:PleD family two-component response regulator
MSVQTLPAGRERRAASERRRPVLTPWILVVDGDASARALYRESLAIAGCDVVEASDGSYALAQAVMHPPSLVLTEVTLPFVDGYTLCELLRRDTRTADVPILVVTTETRPAQIDRARKAGADVVLTKPTGIENILNEMRRLIADRARKKSI